MLSVQARSLSFDQDGGYAPSAPLNQELRFIEPPTWGVLEQVVFDLHFSDDYRGTAPT